MPQAAQKLSSIKRKTATPKPDNRPSAAKRGYGSRWQRYRLAFLRKNPLCTTCDKEGIIKAANVVDHIIPHKGDMTLFWQTSNHQGLCKRHHDQKTATEDGGFGHKRKA